MIFAKRKQIAILDDADQPCELQVNSYHTTSAWRDPRARRALSQVTMLVAPRSVLWVSMIFMLVVGVVIVALPLQFSIPIAALCIVLIASLSLSGRSIMAKHLAKNRDAILDAALCVSVCPGCAYDLSGVATSNDAEAIIDCPECGAAWSAGRLIVRKGIIERPESEARSVLRYLLPLEGHPQTTRMIQDDRGAERRLLNRTIPEYVAERMPELSSEDRLLCRAVDADVRSRSAILRLVVCGVIGFVWLGILLGAAFNTSVILNALRNGSFQILELATVAFYTWIIIWLFLMIRHVWRSPMFVGLEARETMLYHRFCPSCSEDLRNQKPDLTDGLTVCPFCSAAWRIAPG